LLVICVRSEWWEGQNKRTGDVGQFPEIVFSLLPLRPTTTALDNIASTKQQTSETKTDGETVRNMMDQPLTDFGNLVSLQDIGNAETSARPPPFSNWTTFESTTDLPQAARGNPISSVNPVSSAADKGGMTQNDGASLKAGEKPIALCKCSDSSLGSRPTNSSMTKCSSENFDDRRRAVMDAGCSYDVEIDIPDSALLLPQTSQTSVSEPCSPAHVVGVDNPNLLVPTSATGDNVCFVTAGDGYCRSLPAADRLSWMTSSSCENLGVVGASHSSRLGSRGAAAAAYFDEHVLAKASSDMSVYIGSAPPVPPRDYPAASRHKSGDAAHTPAFRHRSLPKNHGVPLRPHHQQHTVEIHPIVQDGQRRSSTHYWLLPEKHRFDPLPLPCEADGSESISYVNVPDAHRSGKSAQKPTKLAPSAAAAASAEISHSQIHDMMRKLEIIGDRPQESMAEIRDKVELVRVEVGVDAVTFEESLNALSLSRWSVPGAVEYIKVEHLFRLGIASRDICREALVAFQWDLLKAASCLVDRQSAEANLTH